MIFLPVCLLCLRLLTIFSAHFFFVATIPKCVQDAMSLLAIATHTRSSETFMSYSIPIQFSHVCDRYNRESGKQIMRTLTVVDSFQLLVFSFACCSDFSFRKKIKIIYAWMMVCVCACEYSVRSSCADRLALRSSLSLSRLYKLQKIQN